MVKYALNKDGNITKCVAPDGKEGVGKCNHYAHQHSNESPEQFIDRASKIDKMDKNQFITALKMLDEKLDRIMDKDQTPVKIRAIGGFALLMHNLRDQGTADIDTLSETFSPEIRAVIKEVGEEQDLLHPDEWVNNDMVLDDEYLEDILYQLDPTWEETEIDLRNIDLKIADIETVLRSKFDSIEFQYEIKGNKIRKFSIRPQDIPDILNILKRKGITTPEEFKYNYSHFRHMYPVGYRVVMVYLRKQIEKRE